MTIKLAAIRKKLQGMPGSHECTPFGPEVLVYKVGNKMFALLGWQNIPTTVNLKCDPDRAVELRERFEAIAPGYHMNKQLWNTLTLDRSLDRELVWELVQHSYDLIVASLTKKARAALEAELGG